MNPLMRDKETFAPTFYDGMAQGYSFAADLIAAALAQPQTEKEQG